MSDPSSDEFSRLLQEAGRGVPSAVNQLLPIVYDELRQLAAIRLAEERPGISLQATALVHEVYMRLVRQQTLGFDGRAAFFSAAASIMRRILVDHARSRLRQKRGSGAIHTTLDEAVARIEQHVSAIEDLDEALNELAKISPRPARLVELRFLVGLSMEEVAETVGISQRTAERDWKFARAWLRDFLDRRSGN